MLFQKYMDDRKCKVSNVVKYNSILNKIKKYLKTRSKSWLKQHQQIPKKHDYKKTTILSLFCLIILPASIDVKTA